MQLQKRGKLTKKGIKGQVNTVYFHVAQPYFLVEI